MRIDELCSKKHHDIINQKMADIFISYKREDREWAEALSKIFHTYGWTVWWDMRLSAGESFDETIEFELYKARCVVVLWSKASRSSQWVKTEATIGMERKVLVPIRIEAVNPPLAFKLIHTADLIGWNKNEESPELQILIDSVIRVLGPPLEFQDTKKDSHTDPSRKKFHSRSKHQRNKGLIQKISTKEDKHFEKATWKLFRDSKNHFSKDLPPEYTNEYGIEFVLINPGEFNMGSNKGAEDELPVHRVEISLPFYLGKYTITQSQWRTVMEKNPSFFKMGEHYPVIVSWREANEFLSRLNENRSFYRLPTEAEWEYACRAGTSTEYFFGENVELSNRYVISGINDSNNPHPVGSKEPNPWGLYDTLGNVWEWCSDWYASDYYLCSPMKDPIGPDLGELRVLRGGSFLNIKKDIRCALRFKFKPFNVSKGVGFRLVMDLPFSQ